MFSANTIDLKVEKTDIFKDSLSQEGCYIAIAKSTPWENENTPPRPTGSFKEFFQFYKDKLESKRILKGEAFNMARRNTWKSGVVYDNYRHDLSYENKSTSNNKSLDECIYYVINSQNDIYICLDNAKGAASLVEPNNQFDVPFTTTDGYQWLRISRLSGVQLQNYATPSYIPIIQETAIKQKDGIITTVIIESGGKDYSNTPYGVKTRRPFFYCRIVGDGEGAIAKVTVLDGRVTEVDVIDMGEGYTYGEMLYENGTVFASLEDLQNGTSPLNPEGVGLSTSVIIGPPGGWGSDLKRQLSSHDTGLFTSFSSEVDEDPFRQIGILHRVEIDEDLNEPIANSGYLTYLSNFSPVTRSAGESIRISIIFTSK